MIEPRAVIFHDSLCNGINLKCKKQSSYHWSTHCLSCKNFSLVINALPFDDEGAENAVTFVLIITVVII